MSGGTRESALEWFEKKKLSAIPLLLNPEKTFHHHLGCLRSIRKTWNLHTMQLYAEEKIAGIPSAVGKLYSGDDLHLMGGDFILNSAGVVLYAYHQRDTRDRPNVSTLLSFIKEQ